MARIEFKGKQFIHSHHHSVPYRELKVSADKSLSNKPSLDDNLIIHGDNLHALKALLPRYAGKVDCIYIDPPYNTGNEGWCYNDNVSSPLIKEWLAKATPVDKEDMERHDKWLCMMWPRLQLLRELLSEMGVIFVSIDENEEHHLRMILDEIFGEDKFVEKITWNKRVPKNDKGIGNIHEYILIYVKSTEVKQKFVMPKQGLEDVYELVSQLKAKHTPIELAEAELKKFYNKKDFDRGITLYNQLDADYKIWGKVNVSWPNSKDGPRYDVLHPKTNKPVKVPDNGWRWKRETFDEKVDYSNTFERHDGSYVCGRIWFAKDENTQPSFIQYIEDVEELLLRSIISTKSSGITELTEVIPSANFSNPKPKKLLWFLLNSLKNPNSIILDSFAGSGTTAHAVLDLNKQDGGNRKFILVEMEGYANDITAERVRRVIKGVPTAKDKTLQEGLGGSFTYAELGDAFEIEKILNGENLPSYGALASYVFYTATGQSLPAEITAPAPDYYVGESTTHEVYLVYQPDLAFLRSNESALNQDRLDAILARKSTKPKLVFATAKYMGQNTLSEHNISFCQLPYAIHKVMGA
jgi:adenine-specific DNA-methyltransferase